MGALRLQGKTIGYLVGPEVEDLEYWVPLMRLREEGGRVISIGITNQILHGKHGLEIQPDVCAEEAPSADGLAGLVIPGGWAPDKMRRNPHMLQLVRDMDAQGKIIGSICHGGWVPISAGIMRGHKATGWRRAEPGAVLQTKQKSIIFDLYKRIALIGVSNKESTKAMNMK